nr:NADH dehydrogenase subunit 2 [Cheiraster sp. SS-2022]
MSRNVTILLIFNVILSTLVVLSSHHFFTIWIGLEMNTLSILPVLVYQFSARSVESTVKYFLVQSFSAAIILNVGLIQAWIFSSWSIFHPLNILTSSLLSLALALKLGLFPCHYWFPDVIQGISFLQGLILSTWQKVAPFVVLSYVIGSLNGTIIVLSSVMSVLVGGWGGLNQTQVRKILAFSSIAHIGWICSVVYYSSTTAFVMFFVYIIINSCVFLLMSELGFTSLSSISRLAFLNWMVGFITILIILSLGGLPPLTGFLIKFLALECLVNNVSFTVSVLLAGGSLISLFYYLRIAFNSSLIFFPQHSLTMFLWRSLSGYGSIFSVYGVFLSVITSISLFGLFFFPVLGSVIE